MTENQQLLDNIHLLTFELISYTYDIKESNNRDYQISCIKKIYKTTYQFLSILNCPFDGNVTPPFTMPVFWHDIHGIELQLRGLIGFYLNFRHCNSVEYPTEKAINSLYLILSFLSNMCKAIDISFEELCTQIIDGEVPLLLDTSFLPSVKKLINTYKKVGRPTNAQRDTALRTSDGNPIIKPGVQYRKRRGGHRSVTNVNKYIRTLAKHTNIPYDELMALKKAVRIRKKEEAKNERL